MAKDPIRERLAQLIYNEAMLVAASYYNQEPPRWVLGGNSHAQEDARRCADKVLLEIDAPLGLQEYQVKASATAIYPVIGGAEVYPALGLANEAGEVLGKIKKCYRDKGGTYDTDSLDAIEAELGDVLWYLSQLALELGISLEQIAKRNLGKLQKRQDAGTLKGDGDNR
jgi:NTP pyrophosphatase (non-canonical NTP hydrolase)